MKDLDNDLGIVELIGVVFRHIYSESFHECFKGLFDIGPSVVTLLISENAYTGVTENLLGMIFRYLRGVHLGLPRVMLVVSLSLFFHKPQ